MKKDSRTMDMSAKSQRARLLARLKAGPIDTIAARAELAIMCPAARVMELKHEGHEILSHRNQVYDDQGYKHQGVSTYYLSGDSHA